MDYNNMKVVELKASAKKHGLKGNSKLKKAELITFLQNNLQPTSALHTRPPSRPPKMSTWEPIDDRLRPTPQASPSFMPRHSQPSDLQNPKPYH